MMLVRWCRNLSLNVIYAKAVAVILGALQCVSFVIGALPVARTLRKRESLVKKIVASEKFLAFMQQF
jgi:hypothetical protein